MTYKYRATWQQEDLMEFALSHTVRYRDPLNKKRFAIPYKDAQKAADKMAQLKRDGVKEIEITKDILSVTPHFDMNSVINISRSSKLFIFLTKTI